MFCAWLPPAISDKEALYSPPVAFDTVMSSLLSDRLPARILIHGAPGNGKTRMLKQIQLALESKVSLPDKHLCQNTSFHIRLQLQVNSIQARRSPITYIPADVINISSRIDLSMDKERPFMSWCRLKMHTSS